MPPLSATFATVLASMLTLSLSAPGAAVTSAEEPHGQDSSMRALPETRPVPLFRASTYDGGNWAAPDQVVPLVNAAGDLEVATVDIEEGSLLVDTYRGADLAPVAPVRRVDLTGWPLWGGLYLAPDDSRFVVVGRPNEDERDDAAVVAIRRYDSEWRPTGTAVVLGGASHGIQGISVPFDAGSPSMVQVGDRLVVHFSRLMYTTPDDGLRHQGNFTVEVDLATMVATPFEELGDIAYTSHSFQQKAGLWSDDLLLLDHGDAYDRGLQLGVIDGYPGKREVESLTVMKFNDGGAGNFTGTELTGMVTTSVGVLITGRSVRHPDAPTGPMAPEGEARNAYVLRVDLQRRTARLVWLTNLAASGSANASETRIVALPQDRYAVLHSVVGAGPPRMEYHLLDAHGTVLDTTTFPETWFSPISQPVVLDDAVVWVGADHGAQTDDVDVPTSLVGIDVSDPAAPVLLGSGPGEPTLAPVNTTPPTITGRHRRGSRLTLDPGTWEPAPEGYAVTWSCSGTPMVEDRWQLRVTRRWRGCRVSAEVAARLGNATSEPVSTKLYRRVR